MEGTRGCSEGIGGRSEDVRKTPEVRRKTSEGRDAAIVMHHDPKKYFPRQNRQDVKNPEIAKTIKSGNHANPAEIKYTLDGFSEKCKKVSAESMKGTQGCSEGLGRRSEDVRKTPEVRRKTPGGREAGFRIT